MHIMVKTEINLARVLREEVETAEDLARIALEALDQCQARFYRTSDHNKATAVANARTVLANALSKVYGS